MYIRQINFIRYYYFTNHSDFTYAQDNIYDNTYASRSSKCLKTAVKLTFTTQKASACSPWTACSVFNWKYLSFGKFGPKTLNYHFKLTFCT